VRDIADISRDMATVVKSLEHYNLTNISNMSIEEHAELIETGSRLRAQLYKLLAERDAWEHS